MSCIYSLKDSSEGNSLLTAFLKKPITFRQEEKPLVSIIIPVFNNYQYTACCLHSVFSSCINGSVPFEIIIADDNSTDKTTEISNYFKNITVVKNNTGNKGFLHNVNHAAQYARGKFLLLLNNDTIVFSPDDFLQKLITVFNDNTTGVVGCKLLYPDLTLYNCGRVATSSGFVFSPCPNRDCLFEIDLAEGSAFCIPKTIWDYFHGFDVIYQNGYQEESDLCMKIKFHLKKRILTEMSCHVIHFISKSYSNPALKQELLNSNGVIFFNRWKDFLRLREQECNVVSSDNPMDYYRKIYGRQ